ncbi:hypothetical protein BTM25_20850 [Actinomadura rubteroloni]|uniref:Lipoprotein n=1 Tax=Actinomadura rubteroloni TaxID=1926885 RepID=A0A2P4URJ1_9ACTN|nr:hypothetical protein [Actinomadura rubteroloni]POM27667.1 hypothetical protein BTM25_20850 [Actinomadura rubteroloni]
MRWGRVRVLSGSGVLLAALGLTAGCGGNSAAVCSDAKAAYAAYMTQVRTVPAGQPAQWKAPTDQLAAKLGALAGKADDGKLRSALNAEAGRLRAASTTVAAGDMAQLNTVLAQTPRGIGKACD